VRSVNGFLGRLIGNLYEEFWPDAHRLLRKRWRRDGGSQTS